MQNTEQTLSTAISELKCLRPGTPAAIDELTALRVTRDCVDELLRACVAELRAGPHASASWESIAYAIGSPSAGAARQHYGPQVALAEERVLSFWQVFGEAFAWDFVPTDFVHALYTHWMSVEFPGDQPFRPETFTRRLKTVATASGEWVHTRSRPGSLMNAREPLVTRLPNWSTDESGRAVWGFRRSRSLMRAAAK